MTRKSARLQQHSRHVVLGALGVFVLAQLGGGALLDYRWPQLRFPAAYQHFEALEQMQRSPNLLFLGSSRIKHCLDAGVLTQELRRLTGNDDFEAFGGAIPAGDPIVMEFAFRELTRRGARPELVILEITPEALNRRNDWINEHVLRQLRWDDLPHYLGDIARTRNWGRLALSRCVPLFVHRHELTRVVREELAALVVDLPRTAPAPFSPIKSAKTVAARPVTFRRDESGATPETPPAVHPRYAKATQGGLHAIRRYLRDYQIGGRPCEALERLLAQCRAQGCRVLLLGAPVTAAHRALYTPAMDAEYRRYVDELRKAYGCSFTDCRDRLPDHLFHDNHHALPEGAQVFSRLAAEEVLPLIGGKLLTRR